MQKFYSASCFLFYLFLTGCLSQSIPARKKVSDTTLPPALLENQKEIDNSVSELHLFRSWNPGEQHEAKQNTPNAITTLATPATKIGVKELIQWGPGKKIPKGEYEVIFKFRHFFSSNQKKGPVLAFDIFDTQNKTILREKIHLYERRKAAFWQESHLKFSIPSERTLEFRTFSYQIANTELRSIYLLQRNELISILRPSNELSHSKDSSSVILDPGPISDPTKTGAFYKEKAYLQKGVYSLEAVFQVENAFRDKLIENDSAYIGVDIVSENKKLSKKIGKKDPSDTGFSRIILPFEIEGTSEDIEFKFSTYGNHTVQLLSLDIRAEDRLIYEQLRRDQTLISLGGGCHVRWNIENRYYDHSIQTNFFDWIESYKFQEVINILSTPNTEFVKFLSDPNSLTIENKKSPDKPFPVVLNNYPTLRFLHDLKETSQEKIDAFLAMIERRQRRLLSEISSEKQIFFVRYSKLESKEIKLFFDTLKKINPTNQHQLINLGVQKKTQDLIEIESTNSKFHYFNLEEFPHVKRKENNKNSWHYDHLDWRIPFHWIEDYTILDQ